jgi:hypothetical protein
VYTLVELAGQYTALAEALRTSAQAARALALRETDPKAAYLRRRQTALLGEMFRDARDIGRLLAHYYDGSPARRRR